MLLGRERASAAACSRSPLAVGRRRPRAARRAAPWRIDPLGAALALGAAVGYAVYILAAGTLGHALDPRALSALVCAGAAATFAVAGMATGRSPSRSAPRAGAGSSRSPLVSTVRGDDRLPGRDAAHRRRAARPSSRRSSRPITVRAGLPRLRRAARPRSSSPAARSCSARSWSLQARLASRAPCPCPSAHPSSRSSQALASALPEGDRVGLRAASGTASGALAFVDGEDVYLQSRNGRPLRRYFPELTLPAGRVRPRRRDHPPRRRTGARTSTRSASASTRRVSRIERLAGGDAGDVRRLRPPRPGRRGRCSSCRSPSAARRLEAFASRTRSSSTPLVWTPDEARRGCTRAPRA